MKKKILISTFDMEVGGVERSLISLLENFDYEKYEVDLLLYRQTGDFMSLLPNKVNLLPEIREYTTFRKSIKETISEGHVLIGLARVLAKLNTNIYQKIKKLEEPGYYQMQVMWKNALPFLPKLNKKYDVAISYLWPHYFVANKVSAKKKIAWIHTDYSTIETDANLDLRMWDRFDHIVAVSEACKSSFLSKYNELNQKVKVIENIISVDFIQKMSNGKCENLMESDKRFKILTVARLSHAKGIDNAVRALKKLRDKGYEDIAWYVVGYGGDEEKIKKLILDEELDDSFILLGKQLNPYPFINAADLYVQPSRYEGKAITVTEAQILGKAVLITDYPTAIDQVDNKNTGLITQSSVKGIVDGIEQLYINTKFRRTLEQNCKRTSHVKYKEIMKLKALLQ
jgi:glycosyltransferase involved in cell wall biosynthesis